MLVLVAACSDDGVAQDGSESGASETGAASEEGDATATGGADACAPIVVGVDDDCFGIGSAQSYIDMGAAANVATLEWVATMTPDVEHTPATGTTMLTVALVYDGGEVLCHPQCDPCPPGEKCPGAIISPSLEIDLTVELSTEDGALAENSPTILFGGPDFVTNFQVTMPASDVQGTLALDSPTGVWPELSMDLRNSYADGAMTGYASVLASDGPMSTAVSLARWPPQ
jgi:hypothetical protein